ncbi:MAG TPA: 2-oxo-4-hydroxy-4-carboxy-5-ureidoimidazoline decarboxylase [Opitutaceae bacterium]|jgi:OHCU decarboxylase
MKLAEINGLSREAFAAALGRLFEHSPWVAEAAWERRPFADLAALHLALCTAMQSAPEARKRELIRAHPDLAGRMAKRGQLTAESTREQASAGLDRLSPGDMNRIQELNGAYRTKFGFPFVICARLNDCGAILAAMERRLANSPEREKEAALAEIEKIAWLRLQDTVMS